MYVGTHCLGDIYSQVQFLTEFCMHITGLTCSFRQTETWKGKKKKILRTLRQRKEEARNWFHVFTRCVFVPKVCRCFEDLKVDSNFNRIQEFWQRMP